VLAWTERMTAERKLGARLEHPHIARVFDAGVDARGRPYLVTARVLGADVIRHARRRRLPAAARLSLMLQACAAVSHVHGLRWAHGRLKPSNLRIDDAGCVQLLDSSMARLLAGWRQRGPGGDDQARGGPDAAASPYVPPEQRQGAAPSVAQDVHALGVLLGELMADAPGVGPLKGDLQAVVERATAKDPLARYETVAGLAADVRNLIEHLPVLAAPAGRAHGAALWLRRHRLALVAGTCAVALLAAVTARLWQQHVQAQSLDDRDRQARAFMDEAFPRAGRDAQRWQAALVRARQGFEGQPTLRGQVLAQLGVAGRAIGQPEGALQVLGEAHSLLQRVARADDPARLGAAAELASQWLLNGKPETSGQATAWAQQALAVCRDASAGCAKTRASAYFALSLVARARNDTDAQRQALERQARELAEARRLAPEDE
jgi:serine/threonine-protein kinase